VKSVILIWLLASFSHSAFALKPSKIQITIERDIYEQAQVVLGAHTAASIQNFAHPDCQRDVVDFILVQKALFLGGFHREFEFHLGNFDARNIKMLTKGILLVSFDTIWLSHAEQYKNNVYISAPVIRKGEYWAGVFTSLENLQRIQLKKLADLQALSIVSSKDWFVDWQTLTNIGPKELIHEPDWISMAKLVSMGWIDVMLAPFKNQYPFQYKGGGYHIKAIEGVKVALDDSRHFVFSKLHPDGLDAFKALEAGLAVLRKQGFIKRAYQECGFFNAKVADWTLLNHQ